MKNTVVVGAQWGDEGKAKITDLLAENSDVVIRYQGGCNAGHTVVANGKKYKFHLIPSGVLYGNKTCIISAGTVIHPETFQKEVEALKVDGIALDGLKIHPLASITMPWHIAIDGWSEASDKALTIGTTKKGIGPTYTDKIARTGLKIEDLYDLETLRGKLEQILSMKNKLMKDIYNLPTYDIDETYELCQKYAEIFKPFVFWNWQEFYENTLKENKKILFEGAQGVLLDIDWGTYPYVTSSNPVAGGAATGSGFGINATGNAIGVAKAYTTRVGEGPFVTELLDDKGESIRVIGNEYGTTTGRPRRCGWLDALALKYAVLVSGLSSVALTKIDVFNDFDEFSICTAYTDTRDNSLVKHYPTNTHSHKYMKPVLKSFKGWKSDISKCQTYDELPENAKIFIKELEEYLGVPVSIVSVGPDREQTIIR